MSNEIVKYDTELNTIPLRNFTPTEMNLFFSIVSRMRDKNSQVIRFSFDQLKDLSDYKMTAQKAFIKDLERTYDKLMDLRFSKRSNSGLRIQKFVMFTKFDINAESSEPYVDVQVHDMALPLLNNLESWVRYSLTEFRDLHSSYSKTMFRLLKQFRTTGYAEFTKDTFYELLDVPKSYRQSDITKKILKPIKEELSPIFSGLIIRKKYGQGRGKPVKSYSFHWKPEQKNADDFSKGLYMDQLKKIKNIEFNGELTDKEKWTAIDKVKGLKLGTTKKQVLADKVLQEEKEDQEQLIDELVNIFN